MMKSHAARKYHQERYCPLLKQDETQSVLQGMEQGESQAGQGIVPGASLIDPKQMESGNML